MKIGIVGFSFGLTEKEPSHCNLHLAMEIGRIAREELGKENKVVIIAQWEIDKALKYYQQMSDYVVRQKEGVYLDSDMVMHEAASVFKAQGVTEVVVVANPFLHLGYCRNLARKNGFKVLKRDIKQIGFCKNSLHWWTRSPLNFVLYAIRVKLTGKRG